MNRALALSLVLIVPCRAQETPPTSFDREIRPLLETHCFSCHGPRKQNAKVDLSIDRTEADLGRNQEKWLSALKQLKSRAMPPDDAKKQPSEAERDKLVAWLEGAMARVDERTPKDPGRVTLRRLNRTEYNNTIRDLIGLDLRPADDFPQDDVSEGFDSLGEVLTVSPLLLDKYVDAADRILDKAMVADGPVSLLERRFEAEAFAPVEADGGSLEMLLEREFTTTIPAPVDGRYEVRLRGCQTGGPDGAAVVVVKVDGVDTAILRVTGVPGTPAEAASTIFLQAGDRKIAFRHTPYKAYNKDEKVPDVRLTLDRIDLAGPERSLSHRRIFFVEGGREAAVRIVERFARRAFRRPVPTAELERTLRLYDAGRAGGKSFAAAVRMSLWSVLVSPHFLFRVENGSSERDDAGAVRLSDWELASRLSYFLWSTMPDPTLFDLAQQGRLHDPATLKAQARRMLADPRARAFVDNFAGQWLGLRKLEHVYPDRELFPGFSEPLRRAMHEEAWQFFAHLVKEDRSVLELIQSDYTFLNDSLARHYGIKGVQGDAMRRVTLTDPNRGGVMTMAAILTITSHPTRTSAVKRGKWILDEILGAPPPPPPPNVPELDQASKDRPDAKTLSLRQRMELHRADPQCFGCHKRMDVLGLGLENFDPLGRWRDKEAGRKIEVAGTLPTGESFASPSELKKVLLASKDEFARSLTEKMMVYALGRPVERCDRREIKRGVEELRMSGYRFSALIDAVVTSYPFRYRRAQ